MVQSRRVTTVVVAAREPKTVVVVVVAQLDHCRWWPSVAANDERPPTLLAVAAAAAAVAAVVHHNAAMTSCPSGRCRPSVAMVLAIASASNSMVAARSSCPMVSFDDCSVTSAYSASHTCPSRAVVVVVVHCHTCRPYCRHWGRLPVACHKVPPSNHRSPSCQASVAETSWHSWHRDHVHGRCHESTVCVVGVVCVPSLAAGPHPSSCPA